MKIIDLLAPNCILPNLQATNKKAVLEELAESLTPESGGLSLQTVMEVLLDRERLAKISRMLMSQPFRDNLMQAKGAEEIYRLIAERDAEF